MKVLMQKPPIWDDVCIAFGIKAEAWFTYGDTIYCVDVPFPPAEIIEHEHVHMEQQLAFVPDECRTIENIKEGAALWWGKYLRDPEFRLDQEARAYAKQYAFICNKIIKDRNRRSKFLIQLARSLSGPLYNKIIGQIEAMKLIKKYSNIK